MGLSLLTRYDLFLESSNLIESGGIVRFRDAQKVRNMYFNSAQLLRGFEDIINNGREKILPSEYQNLFNSNAEDIQDLSFVEHISAQISQQMNAKRNSNSVPDNSFKTFFRHLLKAIADYQEEVIEANYIGLSDNNRNKMKQTFLSYAYYDKGLSQALFYYFWNRHGFLYVNWMWEGASKHSSVTKVKLEDALKDSDQLLFLRTTNSELRIRGNNNSIRQWCAWEIGNFYTKHKSEKYYTSFYDKEEPRNDLLDTFQPMKEVIMGEIQ